MWIVTATNDYDSSSDTKLNVYSVLYKEQAVLKVAASGSPVFHVPVLDRHGMLRGSRLILS